MKEKRFTRVSGVAVLVVVAVFLLLEQTRGQDPTRPDTNKSNPANQRKEIPKRVDQQSKKVTLGPSTFTRHMPFGEAIDILRYSVHPPLNIVVLWRDLSENADIDKDTAIGMDGVSGIPLRQHLELLLLSVSAGSPAKLGYAVQKGVIIIGTQESLPAKMKTRIYDITDLMNPPANYFWGGPMGYYGAPYGGMGYGGYGRGFGSGGTGYYGGPYRGGPYGGAYGSGGYSGYLYGPGGGYGYNRGGGIPGVIDTLYGRSGRRSYRRNRGTSRNR